MYPSFLQPATGGYAPPIDSSLAGSPGFANSWGMGGGAPYMTPAGGMEVLAPMQPQAQLNPLAFMPKVNTAPGVGAGAGVPGAGPQAGAGSPLGFNLGTGQLALSGLQTLGGLWAAFESRKMAKQQFNYTKEITDTNLGNQIRSYNTQLTDRANTRAIVNGQSAADRDRYIEENRARRGG